MDNVLKTIMKREKVSAGKLAAWMKIGPRSFRGMLRGEIKMDHEIFMQALDQLGYKMIIAKKTDIV